MNVKHLRRGLCTIALWIGNVAWAQDLSPYMLQDPLMTRPEVLKNGATLPSDGEILNCRNTREDGVFDFNTPLPLSAAVDMALCNHPQARSTWAAIKIQAGVLGEARAAYLPTVNATISKLNNKNVDLAGQISDTSSNGRTKNYSLTYRLFDFGARSANLEAANQSLIAALASHDAMLQKVLNSVIGGYFDAMTAQAAYVSRAQAFELAVSTLQASQRREKQGVAALSDTLQAQTALAKAKLALHRAQGDKHKAFAVLMYAMGMPTRTDVLLPSEFDVPQTQYVSDLAQWLQEAQAKHPAIASSRAQWLAAQAKVKATSAAGLPTLDYNHNYYENGYPNQGLNALGTGVTTRGFALTIPLFDGFGSTYRVRGAQAQAEQAQAQLADTEQQILMEVVKTHADALSALGNLQSSENLLLAARAAVGSSQKRYDKGAADVLEVLSTQSALTDAEQERVRCLADWRSARLKLMASAGLLGRGGLD